MTERRAKKRILSFCFEQLAASLPSSLTIDSSLLIDLPFQTHSRHPPISYCFFKPVETMVLMKPRRKVSSSKIRQSIHVVFLCLHSSSLSARAFTSLHEIPRRVHFPSYADISVRTWARQGAGSTIVSYPNDTSAASSDTSSVSEKRFPTRIVGNNNKDASALKAAAEASTRRNVEINRNDAGAWYQREEMLQHDILTKEAEYELGNAIIHAKKLRDEMTDTIETMRLERDENNLEELLWEDNDSVWSGRMTNEEGMESMSIYDTTSAESKGFDSLGSWEGSLENQSFAGDQRISSTLVRDGSKLSRTAVEADLKLLSDDDIKTKMNIKGGKEELREILSLGSEARTSLMRSNIRLVVSISKKWMGSSFAAGNSNGSRAISLYSGGWDRPSLDEVIQEGILGLARAVDKFDPSRGLRFSTYSTHWITSYVRQSFQSASTGCLKVPSQLHEIKVSVLLTTVINADHIYLKSADSFINTHAFYKNIEFLQGSC